MNWNDVNKLEKEYLILVLGEEPTNSDDLTSYVGEFVPRSYREKDTLKALQSKAIDSFRDNGDKSYMEIYHSMLVSEIRDLKIKKIC